MGFCFWRSFYNVFLEDEGFTGAQIGTINSLVQAMMVLVVPIAGYFADKRGIRPVLAIATVGTAISLYFLGYITWFPGLLTYLVIVNIFLQPVGSLSDALAAQYSQENNKSAFGKLRMWGSLGWSIAAFGGGYLFSVIDIKYIFPASAFTLLLALPLIIFPINRKHVYKADFKFIKLKDIYGNRKLLVFMVILLVFGAVCAPAFAFLNLYFKDLGANNTVIGMAYAIQAISELPFFIIGDILVKKMGYKKVIAIAIIAMSLRLFLYWLIPNTSFALSLGLLQGLTMSFFLVGAVNYLRKLLPHGLHATAQSIIWALYFGLGQVIGNLAIGFIKDTGDMVVVMRDFAFLSIALMIFTYFFFIRKNQLS
jgi:PPP family 3-phenylpropionic acid transporter